MRPAIEDGRKTRTEEEVHGTGRSAATSLWRTYKERRSADFLTSHLWPWLTHYLSTVFKQRHEFLTYPMTVPRPGITLIPSSCKIGIAGDWGTGTESAYDVANKIGSRKPDYTVHLGDVYYSGTSEEYRDYFLPSWPRGSKGTFVLNANHEMYSGGSGYFDTALKALHQPTSYFCLENDNWRILAVDTGYYARSVPLLELFLKGLIRLHDSINNWLKMVVFADPSDRRPVVLLSHHQVFSSYDTEYTHVGRDLEPYLDRVLLWLWAHEHRFAAYAPYAPNGKPIRARCMGHGGMPIELGEKPKRDRPLVLVDERPSGSVSGKPIGFCGFAFLTLDGPNLSVEYRDENDVLLLKEGWSALPKLEGSVSFYEPSLTIPPGKAPSMLTTAGA